MRLVTHLDRELFEPEVVCLAGEGELVAPLRAAGIPVTCLNAAGRWDVRVTSRLIRHFCRTRPDLVQTFLFHANIAGRIAARAAGVPLVVSGIRVAERRKRWHLWLDRLTDRFVDRHVCVSRDVADFSQREGHLPADKLVVIPNAVDADLIANAKPADLSEFGLSPDDQVIVFVGRLAEQKDPLRLLEAFRDVSNDFPEARLLFVGTGPLEEPLRRRAGELDGRVAFAGQRSDVPALLKAAACLALPSRWEGMPNVVLEAMAAGTPVVATNVEGIGELLRDGTLGTVVHTEASEALAEGIRQILSDPVAAQEKSRLAQTHVFKQHMVSAIVSDYHRLYCGCLGKLGNPVAIRPVAIPAKRL
ncbi:MAG: glycosyltransferase [Planctomycetaceae bacterium]|nr:glycosyltransferase [Planctomycetaceae bacterium]